MEALKKANPSIKIMLTFFSPSGYEIRKDYTGADAVFYLPIDFSRYAKRFITLVNPSAAVFVKYEFWLNYLNELKRQKIPVYLISAVFRPEQHFFKFYGRIFFIALKSYKKIFLQDEKSFQLLKEKGLGNIEIAGDTRFDRVFEIARTKKELPLIDRFCGSHKILIAGSTWPKDEELVIATYKKLKEKHGNLKLIIAPHEITKTSVSNLKEIIGSGFTLYTNPENIEKEDILIIDTIGILSRIYRYGTVAYIGGGFNDGIHNILEALVYNVPVTFGTNHHKFVEAAETLQLHISKEITGEKDLYLFFNDLISDDNLQKKLRAKIQNYMQNKAGATNKITTELRLI
jgi:3-deoxy-D-manno-octulosonic-acid transferase